MALFGLILAGGKSSRMGFDKALIDFHGEPQVTWLHRVLQSFCERVFVSGSPSKIDGDFNFIEDQYETGGPLNGILSAFNLHPQASWLVVPVDMPRLNDEVVAFLLKRRDEKKMATCFAHANNNMVEPLPVILESPAFPILLDRFRRGHSSLNSFLKSVDSGKICPLDEGWLASVNSPDQLTTFDQSNKKC
jgi:molybdenum cofactor guanylyltransferase